MSPGKETSKREAHSSERKRSKSRSRKEKKEKNDKEDKKEKRKKKMRVVDPSGVQHNPRHWRKRKKEENGKKKKSRDVSTDSGKDEPALLKMLPKKRPKSSKRRAKPVPKKCDSLEDLIKQIAEKDTTDLQSQPRASIANSVSDKNSIAAYDIEIQTLTPRNKKLTIVYNNPKTLDSWTQCVQYRDECIQADLEDDSPLENSKRMSDTSLADVKMVLASTANSTPAHSTVNSMSDHSTVNSTPDQSVVDDNASTTTSSSKTSVESKETSPEERLLSMSGNDFRQALSKWLGGSSESESETDSGSETETETEVATTVTNTDFYDTYYSDDTDYSTDRETDNETRNETGTQDVSTVTAPPSAADSYKNQSLAAIGLVLSDSIAEELNAYDDEHGYDTYPESCMNTSVDPKDMFSDSDSWHGDAESDTETKSDTTVEEKKQEETESIAANSETNSSTVGKDDVTEDDVNNYRTKYKEELAELSSKLRAFRNECKAELRKEKEESAPDTAIINQEKRLSRLLEQIEQEQELLEKKNKILQLEEDLFAKEERLNKKEEGLQSQEKEIEEIEGFLERRYDLAKKKEEEIVELERMIRKVRHEQEKETDRIDEERKAEKKPAIQKTLAAKNWEVIQQSLLENRTSLQTQLNQAKTELTKTRNSESEKMRALQNLNQKIEKLESDHMKKEKRIKELEEHLAIQIQIGLRESARSSVVSSPTSPASPRDGKGPSRSHSRAPSVYSRQTSFNPRASLSSVSEVPGSAGQRRKNGQVVSPKTSMTQIGDGMMVATPNRIREELRSRGLSTADLQEASKTCSLM